MTCTATRTHLVTGDTARAASSIGRTATRRSPVRRLFHMVTRQKWRRALLQMDDHLLKDIGITREQALLEACKWFWQD